MELIQFNDTCTIYRPSGEVLVDDNGSMVEQQPIYQGSCMLTKDRTRQPNALVVYSNVVFIQLVGVDIEVDDIIEITDLSGKIFRGNIHEVRKVQMPLSGTEYIRLDVTPTYEQ